MGKKEKVTEKVVINALIEDMNVVKAIEVKDLLVRYNSRLMSFALMGLAGAFGLILICAGINVMIDYLAIGTPTDWTNFWEDVPFMALYGFFPFVFYSFGFSVIKTALIKKIEKYIKDTNAGMNENVGQM